MPSDESKGSQLDAIGSLAQRQLDNTLRSAQGQRFQPRLSRLADRCSSCHSGRFSFWTRRGRVRADVHGNGYGERIALAGTIALETLSSIRRSAWQIHLGLCRQDQRVPALGTLHVFPVPPISNQEWHSFRFSSKGFISNSEIRGLFSSAAEAFRAASLKNILPGRALFGQFLDTTRSSSSRRPRKRLRRTDRASRERSPSRRFRRFEDPLGALRVS